MRTQPRAPLHITCSRYRETPNYGERLRSWKQRRCRCARKSDPMNGCATPYHHNEGKWLCQHFEAVALPLPDGATAITRVEHQRRSRLCISRPQYETFTLPKQCRTTTYTQEFTISMSHRLCLLGKFSDVAGANRLEADLPEVNLPPCIWPGYGRCYSVNHSDAAARRTGQKPPRLTA